MAKASRFSRILRRTFLVLWIGIIAACLLTYLAAPHLFTAENIAAFMSRFQGVIWLVYLGFSILRGFTLLPSTPLVLAGTLLFPDDRVLVFIVSLVGIAISSSMIYFFSEQLGFHEYFESHKPELTHKIKARLEHPLGLLFVAAWAFFPLVPTDLVCYLAGTTGMKYWKFIAAVMVGEAILCAFYIFFAGSLVKNVL